MKSILAFAFFICGLIGTYTPLEAKITIRDTIVSDSVLIKSSIQCEMCEERVQKALMKTKGIQRVKTDTRQQTIMVYFDANVITVAKIKERIAKTGYDADDRRADKNAYEQLPKCCRKP
jgi:copper chaperone CopZ